jgi:hypothetical protein
LLAVAMLLIAGAVVTATAAPGPATDVKTAQYGSPTVPPDTSGPCKGIGGEAGDTCRSSLKRYRAARKACARKKPARKRKACQKKLKRDYPSFAT